jgi:hypothetical protein
MKMKLFDIYLPEGVDTLQWIDRVFDDPQASELEVRLKLVNERQYPFNIVVKEIIPPPCRLVTVKKTKWMS